MNEHVVSTGSWDSSIKNIDIRTKEVITTLNKHSQEVCGLKWSPEENYLASGGNDNHIYIWDVRKLDK